MTTRIDDLVQHSTPFTDDQVRELPLDEAEAELLAALLADEQPPALGSPAGAPRRRRLLPIGAVAAFGGAAALAFALIGPSLSTDGDLDAGPAPVWAAAAVRVAESVPRLLLDDPDWSVVYANEFTVGDGELVVGDGSRTIDLHWRPAAQHRGYMEDRAHGNDRLADARIAGREAAVFRYSGAVDDYTALWRDGDYSLELRTGAGGPGERLSEAEFRALAARLTAVGVDRWLSAMPPETVRPVDRRQVVREMLRGVPVPPGLDLDGLASGSSVSDRYQLGAHVAGAVACTWIERWLEARRTGNERTAAAANTAMGTARKWPILKEMSSAGAYPDVLWGFADAITEGRRGERDIAANVDNALGCGDR